MPKFILSDQDAQSSESSFSSELSPTEARSRVPRTKRKASASDISPKLKREKPARSRTKRSQWTEPTATKLAANDDDDDDEEEEEEDTIKPVVISRKAQRDRISTLIAQVLSRWWYVFPEWPPPDFDYDQALLERKLKVVSFDDWERVDDVDKQGFTKVYPLANFKGVYRHPRGAAIDLRPTKNKPCYSNLKNATEHQLQEWLSIALKNQLAALEGSPFWPTQPATLHELKAKLTQQLADVEKALRMEISTPPQSQS